MTIESRAAEEQDAEAACQVLRRSISELCIADHHNDEKVLSAWLRNKTPANVRTWIISDKYFSLVALRDSCICGFAMISREGEIQLLYGSPEVHHLGAGKLMLRALEQQALRWNLNKVFLTSTLTAKAFYERNGFKPHEPSIPPTSALKNVFPMAKVVGL